MAKIVVGMFETREAAEDVVRDLMGAGFSRESIRIRMGHELLAQEQGQLQEEEEGLTVEGFLVEGIQADDALVFVEAEDDDRAEDAADILNRYDVIDIDSRTTQGRPAAAAGGQARVEQGEQARTAQARAEETRAAQAQPETRLPVVEEEMQIGKRAVTRGGVRIYTRMVERPVEEQVQLRQEQVQVERHAADRPASEADLAAFKEGTIEVTETSEEPVVAKRARVKEEVTVSKDVKERTEKVQDTVRATEVKVEQLSPEEAQEFATYESELRKEYQKTYAKQGVSYEDLRPVYQYGYHLGRDPKFHDGEWRDIEPRIRRDWEEHHYGPWDRFKDAVRSGWQRATHGH